MALVRWTNFAREGAAQTQVWCALAACALIAIVKKALQFDASLSTCLLILPASAFEKTRIPCALQADTFQIEMTGAADPFKFFDR